MNSWKYKGFTNKIILDPSRDGCTIWFVERNTMKFIQGTPCEICSRIYNFVTYVNNDNQTMQHIKIALDDMACGMEYREHFDNLNLKYEVIKSKHELKI